MIKYYMEYIGEGQAQVSREEAMQELSMFYRDPQILLRALELGDVKSIRLPGGYICCARVTTAEET